MRKVTASYPITEFNGITVNTSLPCKSSNYTSTSERTISYVVMHYTGNTSDTARANASYFNGSTVEASAHYFVDNNSCYQSVALHDRAWHCGGTSYYKHSTCRNANSVGIEMCTSGGSMVSSTTITNAAYLCAALCNYLNISASEVDTYVIRHFDVWGKQCPAQWATTNSAGFAAFKTQVKKILSGSITTIDEREVHLNALVKKGIIENKEIWSDFDSYVRKSDTVAMLDKYTGGTWTSEEVNPNGHWVEKYVYSLCGKGVINSKEVWLTAPDAYISKANTLALIAKLVNDGGTELHQYEVTPNDHWGRNYLNYLCDKGIITTPKSWCDDFEAPVNRGNFMALICKAFNIN